MSFEKGLAKFAEKVYAQPENKKELEERMKKRQMTELKMKRKKQRIIKITRDRCPIKGYTAFEGNCSDCQHRGTSYTSDIMGKTYKFSVVCKYEKEKDNQ